MEDHPVVISRQLHVYGLKKWTTETRDGVTGTAVPLTGQGGALRHSAGTGPQEGPVTHTTRGVSEAARPASCDVFPV